MNLKAKLFGDEDERAVSPVIGVILMVAITVILAAVIAAFVLDLGSSQSTNPSAGFDVNDGTVTVHSFDDGTVEVVCRDSGGSDNGSVSSVGGTMNCGSGESIVAIHENGDEASIGEV